MQPADTSFMPEWAWNFIAIVVGAMIAGFVGLLVPWLEGRRARRTLATALCAELEILMTNLRTAAEAEDPLNVMIKLPELRHSTNVLLSNTDKIGLLGKDNVRALLHAYASVLLWMSEGEDLKRGLENVKDDQTRVEELRSEARAYVSRFAKWAKHAEKLHEEINKKA